MAKSNNTMEQPAAPINPFGDMSLLRDIIMGPKVIEYDQRFAEALALIEKNEEATRQRLADMEKDINARFDRLEKLLTQNVDSLQSQLQNTSKSDKETMADLLVELSKKLKS
jgi:CHASE3 domain sensor protein